MALDPGYRAAFADWLACACGGWQERAALAAWEADPSTLGRIAAVGAAGHALDFDDTYAPGLAHCTAPVAPAALALVAGRASGASMGDVLGAYARGFEATAALARASHPELYRRGWHPTAVCGAVGSAIACSILLWLDEEQTRTAVRLALLQASGLRAAFGTDGKALQVGFAAAAGARAAMLADEGAAATADVILGFEETYGATWAEPDPARPAIRENWIKAYPCCLQTHSAIEGADHVRREGFEGGPVRVRLHPVSVQAAPHVNPVTSLEAKFSIPYTVAFTLLHGPPRVADFSALREDALKVASGIEVEPDGLLAESAAVLEIDGESIAVEAALGSPQRPMTEKQLSAKIHSLTPLTVEELVRDDTPAADVLSAIRAVS
jgi:2-methylcitrate dehydratase PrpD